MKKIRNIIIAIVALVLIAYVWLMSLMVSPPEIADKSVMALEVNTISDSLSFCGDSWLHKNKGGIYELMVSGNPFELGVKNGKLTSKLGVEQEQHFVDFIKTLVPSETTLNYLKYFITIFNKDLDEYISEDYLEEIYGISLYASHDFDYIGDNYHRVLNYHAAHDIGHTIQNMNLVACTAFSVQNEFTKDSSLLVGRNLDFSAGDDFAREKIVAFCKPDKGYKFAYVSWASMIGVLSGMNEHGLTITLNSAKSGIPFSAKTPVSLVSRQVLQYAKNIDEAFEIIKNSKTFVSESFFVSSAIDHKAVVIEKSLDETAIYDSQKSDLVLTNHFQSDELVNTELNQESIKESCSLYRLNRTYELIEQQKHFNYKDVIDVLRDKNGLEGEDIGLGNESAVNQLICCHSVVFDPSHLLMWVSQFPYQENGYLAYDLNVVFADTFDIQQHSVYVDTLNVGSTEFYKAGGVDKYWQYKSEVASLMKKLSNNEVINLTEADIQNFTSLNPNYYYTYYVLGLYYKSKSDTNTAMNYLNQALEHQIPRKVDKNQIIKVINEIEDSLDVK